MVLDILCPEDSVLPDLLLQGLRLLEDDTLGGGGSRGSGRVRFGNLRLTWRDRAYYASGGEERQLASGVDAAGLQAKIREIGDSLFGAPSETRIEEPVIA
jgi:CRISPR-associated protein Csm3